MKYPRISWEIGRYSFLQRASGQIFKDDGNGFSSHFRSLLHSELSSTDWRVHGPEMSTSLAYVQSWWYFWPSLVWWGWGCSLTPFNRSTPYSSYVAPPLSSARQARYSYLYSNQPLLSSSLSLTRLFKCQSFCFRLFFTHCEHYSFFPLLQIPRLPIPFKYTDFHSMRIVPLSVPLPPASNSDISGALEPLCWEQFRAGAGKMVKL